MKILILCTRVPYPDGKADSMTVFNVIRHLSSRHRILLLTMGDKKVDSDQLEISKYCDFVEVIYKSKLSSLIDVLKGLLFKKLPLQVCYFKSRKLTEIMKKIIDREKPDLLYAHLIRSAEYASPIDGIKKILAMQISQTLNYKRMIETLKFSVTKLVYLLEYKKVKSYEPHIMKYFDSCLLISKFDKNAIEGIDKGAKIFYSPHGVDTEFYKSSNVVGIREDAIIFCGVMETPTNIDAVNYFVKFCYPYIKSYIPSVKFYIVGKNPPNSIKMLSKNDPSIIVTGYVDDVRPYYDLCKASVAPMRIAAGLQNKLLVSMAMGVPVVATSIANEGIGAKNNLEILISDDSDRISEDVIRLINQSQYRNSIAAQARRFVEEGWTWEYHLKKLERHMIEVSENN